MRGALSVDEPHGERWDLAVELLARGDGFVSVGPLLLYRDANGPRADGRLHAEVCTESRSGPATRRGAEAAIEAGLRVLDDVVGDQRVARLVEQFGLVREYVYDYETGRTPQASIEPDGTVIWLD
jgi:hypothetical protein